MDHDTDALLQKLMTTTVGRRWLLKAGLGSAAAIAAASLPLGGASPALATGARQTTAGASGAKQTTSAAGASQPTRTANRTLHFALGPALAGAGFTNLELIANGARVPLIAHTPDSRSALGAQGGVLAAAAPNLTHYVQDMPLPSDRGMLISVRGTLGTTQSVVSQMWHVPEATTLAMARVAASNGNGLHSMLGSNERLQSLGVTAANVSSADHVVQMDSIGDAHSTAVALTMVHPNVATVDPTSAVATKSVVGQTSQVATLGKTIQQMQSQGRPFAKYSPATDQDGSPSQIQVKDPTTGKITTSPFSTIQLNITDTNFAAAAKSAVAASVGAVRGTSSLGAVIDKPLDQSPDASTKTWVQEQGVTPQTKPYMPPSPVALAADGEVDVTISNGGYVYGTKTVATGGYDSSGQVPITIYNNYVRWMWAYVQYIGKDASGNDLNLSIDPGAKWPDTKHAKSLGIVPQVFTILGIPIWDTNTVPVTLTFPKEAYKARLLYCSLGNDAYGGGWTQYFPPNAYPAGQIAPTDEVMFPALVTGIFTIGLTAFALATDLSVALAFKTVRNAITDMETEAQQALDSVLQAQRWMTGTEALAATAAAGGLTYFDIKDKGDNADNMWSILLGLGSLIPKLLFNGESARFFSIVAGSLAGEATAEQIAEKVPLIGEVLAVITLLGDVATLAEVAFETGLSPWVVANEVNLTYPATITIERDPRAATFPVTATNWKLQAKVDGGVTMDAITDSVNTDGRVESDPIVRHLTATFGGDHIQWSIVFLDAEGHQVGTGVSPQFVNNDRSKQANQVTLAITELPATITADTVFKRADTTTYSDSAGGYSWSNKVVDSGAVTTSNHIQQVTGASVATTLGVVGAVWKQNNRYYLRGVPIAENGNTISFTSAPKEGYARPPFLLFDSMVDKQDVANHVLLEPDDTTDAYFIRKVTLDPETGAIHWDSSTALGMFTLPVSAAALHSSGRVVAVHTDSGRAGWLHPAISPRPGLAAYFGGSGSQIGLLQSPTALAVTNPGVVLILEAGAAQIAAFDLNGNPVKYFGSDPANLQFTQSLATQGTYLDMAVDGASHIYLLYYSGDGSQPNDYHIDVYNPDGSPLATHSPGVNIAKLSVDFWRSIYGVNFDPLTDEGTTTVRIDPALGVAEPSISRLDPSYEAANSGATS